MPRAAEKRGEQQEQTETQMQQGFINQGYSVLRGQDDLQGINRNLWAVCNREGEVQHVFRGTNEVGFATSEEVKEAVDKYNQGRGQVTERLAESAGVAAERELARSDFFDFGGGVAVVVSPDTWRTMSEENKNRLCFVAIRAYRDFNSSEERKEQVSENFQRISGMDINSERVQERAAAYHESTR